MTGVKKSATGVVTAKCEQHSVICFLHLQGKGPVIIHQELKDIYGKNALSYVGVWKWTKLFKKERTDIHDESRSVQPSVISKELVNAVNELIREDRRIQVREVHDCIPAVSLLSRYNSWNYSKLLGI